MDSIATIAAITIVALNLAASYALLNANSVTQAQRRLQLLLVWLLPVAGSIVVLLFIRQISLVANVVQSTPTLGEPGPAAISPQTFPGGDTHSGGSHLDSHGDF